VATASSARAPERTQRELIVGGAPNRYHLAGGDVAPDRPARQLLNRVPNAGREWNHTRLGGLGGVDVNIGTRRLRHLSVGRSGPLRRHQGCWRVGAPGPRRYRCAAGRVDPTRRTRSPGREASRTQSRLEHLVIAEGVRKRETPRTLSMSPEHVSAAETATREMNAPFLTVMLEGPLHRHLLRRCRRRRTQVQRRGIGDDRFATRLRRHQRASTESLRGAIGRPAGVSDDPA
jgi:hypothetical protein